MKRKIEIPKYKLCADKNYNDILLSRCFEGFELQLRELAPITVPSGAVCFFDAYDNSVKPPFMQKFNTSIAIPFYLSIVNMDGSERIAFAGLKFSEEVATEYRLALYSERDVIKLLGENETPVATQVESGFIAFGDLITRREFVAFCAEKKEHPLHEVAGFEGNSACVFEFMPNQKIAVFSSGFGEGEYPSFIGYNAQGVPLTLIVDFDVIKPSVKERVLGMETYMFDIELSDLYQYNAKLSEDENAVCKWSFVLKECLKEGANPDVITVFRAYTRRAYAYHNLRRLDKALDDYFIAIEVSTRFCVREAQNARLWTLYDNAGTICRELGDLEEAKKLFEASKALGEHLYSSAHMNLIDIYMGEKNYEQALFTAQEMLTVRPSDPVSYIRVAEIYAAMGNYYLAIEYYDILIEKFNWDEAIIEKTAILGRLKRYDEALAVLEAYKNMFEPNDWYFYNKGFLQYSKERFDLSYKNLLRAFDYNKAFVPTLRLLIEIDELILDYARVADWAGKYIEINPFSEYGYGVRAESYKLLGAYTKAVEDYDYILKEISQDPLYRKHSFVCALKMGEYKKAKGILKILKTEKGDYYVLCRALMLQQKGKHKKAALAYASVLKASNDEHILSAATDFYIKTKNKNEAERLLHLLKHCSSPSTHLVQQYRFAKTFLSPQDSERVLENYYQETLKNCQTTQESLKLRIEEIIK